MYKRTARTERFDMGIEDDRDAYSALLQNPLVTITEERKLTESEKDYEEGKIVSSSHKDFLVISWEEKELL